MSKIDPRLKFLRDKTHEDLGELEALGRFAIEVAELPSPKVTLLVEFTGDVDKLRERGFEARTVAGDIATGSIEMDKLDDLADLDSVVKIESSRPLIGELNLSVPEIRANFVHNGSPAFKGSGVIVGIIDSGIDYTHECFRKLDGSSRILAIWDQYITTLGSETSPAGYNYGVEYTKADIDSALATADPYGVVRHRDYSLMWGHGTHVSGIAAGDGSIAGDGDPAFTYVGVAPEADIIVVANRIATEALGDSAGTLDAVNYIFDKAASLGKPVVINQSQGDNLGPHDGTSLLERGIDNLLGGPGRAMVKSAGNAADDDIHAQGTVSEGGSEAVQFVVPEDDEDPDTIDIWYSGQDWFSISITDPGGNVSSVVNPGTTITFDLLNGNRVFIDSVLNDPGNLDNRIYIQIEKWTQSAIEQGTWTITLNGVTVVDGRFDAWIERGRIKDVPQFIGSHLNNNRTISVPGTSDEVITVASYNTRGSDVGDISYFSSLGPTRDGRQKPDIAAPGRQIVSVKDGGKGTDQYWSLSGTSMSSPHVAGAIALMFQRNNALTQSQIKDCLTSSARSDSFTGAIPNNTWGHGKLDVKGGFECKPQYTIMVTTNGNGSVEKYPNQAIYSSGDVVQLTATAESPWSFKEWNGDLTGSANPDSITMDSNKTVTATFSKCPITIVTIGSMLVPYVHYLRLFRNEIVLKSTFRDRFERLLERYYMFTPYVINRMEASPLYKKFVKYFIAFPFVFFAKGVALLTYSILRICRKGLWSSLKWYHYQRLHT